MTTPRKANAVVVEVDGEEEQVLKTSPPESNESPAPGPCVETKEAEEERAGAWSWVGAWSWAEARLSEYGISQVPFKQSSRTNRTSQ